MKTQTLVAAEQVATMPPARPILVFDSGVGGLSVLEPVRRLLPDAPVVYVADNAGFPYGLKTEAQIAARVPALLGRFVERFGPELVVIACNTACTIALEPVRAALDVPVVGTVPAIKPAAALTRTKAVGVLGTEATVRQPYVDRLSADFAGDCLVLRHGSARLVELTEAKLRGRPPPLDEVRAELAGLLDRPGGERIDTVVLACTHFPLLRGELEAVSPRPIAFVDGGEGIARRTRALLPRVPAAAPALPGRAVFTARSSDVESLRPALRAFGISEIVYL